MKNNLLNSLLIILFFAFSITAFSQDESETDDAQAFNNPTYQPSVGYSVFDPQPVYNSPWEWLHQTPQGNTLRWVKMWDANNWYAVGYGGTFMKTTDAGANWFVNKTAWLDNTGANEIIYDAHFFSPQDGYACGGYGTIVKTTDGGLTWDSVGVDGTTAASWYDIYFVNDTLGFVCGTTSGRLAMTTDAGNNWTVNGTIGSGTYYSVFAPDADTILVFSSSGNLQRSTDGGVTWNTVNVGQSSTLYSNKFTDAMNGWVCGSGDNPAYTTDCGLTWTLAATSPTTSTQYDIDVMSAVSYPFSEDFTDATFPPSGWHIKNLLGANDWYRYTSYYNSPPACARISYQLTGGDDWLVTPQVSIVAGDTLRFFARRVYSGNYPPDSLYILVSTTDTSVASFTNIVAGYDGNALSYPDFAQYSVDLSAFAGQSVYIAFRHINTDGNGCAIDDVTIGEPLASSQLFVTGDAFDVFTSTDMGTNWTPIPVTAPGQPWTSTHYSTDLIAPDNFVTVGAFGLINQFDGGTNTAFTNFIKGGTLYDVWVDNPLGNAIACGSATSTTAFDQAIYSTDGGSTWAVSTMLDSSDLDFNRVSMVNSTVGYAAGEDHRVMKTTDGGATWVRVTDPATSTSDLETCAFVDENNGYVFGASGLGYKTTDGGTTWTPLTTTITGTIYGSDFLDVNTGYICGSSGALRMTTDGGTTFTTLDPNNTSTLYSIDMVNSSNGFISGSSGRVRRTADGGVTWDTVDVGYTGVTLYSVSFKDENNGMTGGSVGRTYYTNDGGNTWNFENTSMSTIYHVYVEKTSSDTAAAYAVGTNAYVMRNYHVIVPVELASFSASINGTEVTLSWITATELNNLGFQIERRSAEEEWLELGFVEGHGTTTESQIYSFVDKDLIPGIYNYRIKQIDYDGSYTYYELQEEVDVAAPNNYDLSQNYPNPFNPSTKIKYSVPVEGFVNIAVYNVLGEKVVDLVNGVQKAGNYELTFDARNFASGMYIYRMESGNFVSIKKMMILK